MIKVYHGSSVEVKSPSFEYGRIDADFGFGFYVTTDYEMAEKWACRRRNPIISEYTFDIDSCFCYEFGLNEKWLEFIIVNRKNNEDYFDVSKYDCLIGATADDKLFAIVEQYENGFISDEVAIKVLNCIKIGKQICIKTNNGLDNLHYERSIEISKERISELNKIKFTYNVGDKITLKVTRNKYRSTYKQIKVIYNIYLAN